jgi:alcohol dehydrogenase (NADP+)
MSMTRGHRQAHADAIDPTIVPQQILYIGAKMPAIGLGTFGSAHVPHQVVADAERPRCDRKM